MSRWCSNQLSYVSSRECIILCITGDLSMVWVSEKTCYLINPIQFWIFFIQTSSHPRYLIFFAMLVTALISVSILAQYRLFPVPHIGDIPTTTLSYPFLCLTFDMIAELYGFRTSRKILWLGFISASIMMWVLYAFSQLPVNTPTFKPFHPLASFETKHPGKNFIYQNFLL